MVPASTGAPRLPSPLGFPQRKGVCTMAAHRTGADPSLEYEDLVGELAQFEQDAKRLKDRIARFMQDAKQAVEGEDVGEQGAGAAP